MLTSVPVIDFANADDPSRHPDIVRGVGAALAELGFVAVAGHGIDPALLQQSYEAAAQVFALDDAAKRRCETPQDGRQRGYTPFGVEHAKGQSVADLKEFWHVGRSLPSTHPLHRSGAIPPNRWPAELPTFERAFTRLFAQTEAFANRLLRVIATWLELAPDRLVELTRDGNSVMRVIHYPPVLEAPPGAVRAARHEDINLLTVLPVSTAPGLELLTHDGEWLAVQPPAGTVICDTGDMMQELTQGRLRATTHRVVTPPGTEGSSRYSLPFFMHPRPEVPLDVLFGEGKGRTAGEYLGERLRETGMSSGATDS